MKLFVNFSDEDFTWSYDNQPWTFKAGQSVALADEHFAHFSKHLVNRELQKDNKLVDDPKRVDYLAKCAVEVEADPELAEMPEEVKVLNANVKKARKPKQTPKESPKEEEPKEFPTLSE